MKHSTVGVLAFHGDVSEHIDATLAASRKLGSSVNVLPVRTKKDLAPCQALIIPGGESTTLTTLCLREEMLDDMKTIPFIFGTCAGAIMLAKTILHKAPGQQTLERMDITVDRNAYGAQSESFEKEITSTIGTCTAVFIRAPKIQEVDPHITILAKDGENILGCEQTDKGKYSLALSFHPELTTTIFHEYFLTKILRGI